MHGNADGIQLTSGEFLSWEDVRAVIAKQLQQVDVHNDCYPVNMTFSSCCGFHSNKMFSYGAPYPCVTTIGPREAVAWTDSLAAYLTLYHLTLNKKWTIPQCVPLMNQLAGQCDAFAYSMNPYVVEQVAKAAGR